MSCVLVAVSGVVVARSLGIGSDSTDIAIDATIFPDSKFRRVVNEFDVDGNGKLSKTELQKVEYMDCNEKDIQSLKGIEYFTGLQYLYCENNQLEELDLSKNMNLIHLSCGYNRIKSLDLTSNKKLESLSCYDNPEYVEEEKRAVGKGALESIDVSGCEKLNMMDISGNKVSDLRLNGASGLVELQCQCNYLKELDLSAAKNLHFVDCSSNDLPSLDVSKLPELETLFCDTNALTKLDVTHNPLLKALHCFENNLASLDLSKNLALKSVYCFSNQLTELDLSKAQCLQCCSTYDNKISRLDVGNTALAEVYDEKQLEDLGTYCEFYYVRGGGEDTTFLLSFDKTTRIESEKMGKNACEIDEEHFPDEAFRKYVSESFDMNRDG